MKRLDFSKPVTRRLTPGSKSNDYTNPNTNSTRPSRHVTWTGEDHRGENYRGKNYRGESSGGDYLGEITGGKITRGSSPSSARYMSDQRRTQKARWGNALDRSLPIQRVSLSSQETKSHWKAIGLFKLVIVLLQIVYLSKQFYIAHGISLTIRTSLSTANLRYQ